MNIQIYFLNEFDNPYIYMITDTPGPQRYPDVAEIRTISMYATHRHDLITVLLYSLEYVGELPIDMAWNIYVNRGNNHRIGQGQPLTTTLRILLGFGLQPAIEPVLLGTLGYCELIIDTEAADQQWRQDGPHRIVIGQN